MRQFDYSKLKAIAWDSEVLSLVAQIHECKGRQEMYLAQKPAALDRLVEIAKVQSTEASNKIEGIVTTNTRIKQLCEEKTTPRNRDEEEISGYRDVLNTIHESYEYIPLTANYILQLHGMLYITPAVASAGDSRMSRTISAKPMLTAQPLSDLHRWSPTKRRMLLQPSVKATTRPLTMVSSIPCS